MVSNFVTFTLLTNRARLPFLFYRLAKLMKWGLVCIKGKRYLWQNANNNNKRNKHLWMMHPISSREKAVGSDRSAQLFDMSNVDTKKKLMLEALEKSLGIITTACKAVGISRASHYQYMENDPEYAAKVNELTEVQLDFVESKLIERINKGDTVAIIFYLNNKGKSRGYNRYNEEKRESIQWPSNFTFNVESESV